jgi:hypothetical protein
MNIMLLLFRTTRLQRPDWPAEVHLYDDNNVHFLLVWRANTLLHIGYVDLLSG